MIEQAPNCALKVSFFFFQGPLYTYINVDENNSFICFFFFKEKKNRIATKVAC